MSKDVMQRIWLMRKFIADMNPVEAMEFMKFIWYKSNEEFLISMNRRMKAPLRLITLFFNPDSNQNDFFSR